MPGDARRFGRWAAAGALLALIPNVWLLAGGHGGLLGSQGIVSGFYDAQARALLHGHLSVPPDAVSFEGFRHAGATYIYQGPVPALLRLPILAITHRWDGRLTPLSMLLALLVVLTASSVLHWRVRELWGGGPLRRLDLAWAALVPIAAGTSIVLYLSGWPVVYHESELWGAALSVAALAAIVGIFLRPTGRRIVIAGAWTTAAVLTRVPAGLGPVAALCVPAAAAGLAGLAARRSVPSPLRWLGGLAPLAVAPRRVALGMLAAAGVALLASVAVNEAKFATPFGIPIADQVQSQIDANRRAALAANHGTIFGPQFAPTQAVAWLRPDAVGTTRAFPFVGVPGPPHVVGDVRFDTLQPSLSATTSMTLLCLLCLAGIAAAARDPRRRPVLGLLAGALVGTVGALSIGFVTTRYLADGLPFLMLGSIAGLCALSMGIRAARGRRALVGVGALLALWALAINGGAGLVNGRLLNAQGSEADRASFVAFQDRIDRFLGRRPHGLFRGTALPAHPPGRPGDLFVLGRCEGLFVNGGLGNWLPVERTPATGLVRLTGTARPSGRQRLVRLHVGSDVLGVWGERRGDTTHLSFTGAAFGATRPLDVPGPGGRLDLTISAAALQEGVTTVTITTAGRDVVGILAAGALQGTPALGPGARPLPTPTPACDRLARRSGLL